MAGGLMRLSWCAELVARPNTILPALVIGPVKIMHGGVSVARAQSVAHRNDSYIPLRKN
jgi:hypothetical protein